MTKPLLALGLLTLLVTSALVCLVLYAGDPASPDWWFLAIPFALWIIGPAAIPYVVARKFKQASPFTYAMLVFLVVSSAWSFKVYYQAFFVSTSSTSALVTIFIPLYQWLALGIAALVGGTAVISQGDDGLSK